MRKEMLQQERAEPGPDLPPKPKGQQGEKPLGTRDHPKGAISGKCPGREPVAPLKPARSRPPSLHL